MDDNPEPEKLLVPETEWDEVLRKMLPAGAPFPDEDHMDFSISVDYNGPPPSFQSPSTSGPKTPKFKRHHSLLLSRRNHFNVPRYFPHHSTENPQPPISPASSVSMYSENGNDGIGHLEPQPENGNGGIEHPEPQPENGNDGEVSPEKKATHVKACSRCGDGKGCFTIRGRKKREKCLVCGAEYCERCLLKGMGSMPEGRKCLACIGKSVRESKRGKLGKRSKVLKRVWSGVQLDQVLKAEKESPANLIPAERVMVNGRPLNGEELLRILECENPPSRLKPGKYWYDENSGLWGKEGEKPDRFISAKLSLEGELKGDASKGNTNVYMNGREITKPEIRILKLAKVQFVRGTHLWVYEDGTYEEEGQNRIKGNIWGKASTRFVCSLLSLPVPHGFVDTPNKEPTALSRRVRPELVEREQVQKLLLLGLQGSGSSTIFKQAQFLFGYNFSANEMQDMKHIIQSNLYRYLAVLLEELENFEDVALMAGTAPDSTDALKSPQDGILLEGTRKTTLRMQTFCDWLRDIVSMGEFDKFFPAAAREYASTLYEVWLDPAIQETYKRLKDSNSLPDVAKYFLDQATLISSNEYQPSEKDILYAQGVTTRSGLSSFEFSWDQKSVVSEIYNDDFGNHPSTKYQLIHIKPQGKLLSRKFLAMFEDIRAVIFPVSLVDYDQDQVHSDGSISNKFLACRNLFEHLVRHPRFDETTFVVLLNHYDAFEKKISSVPLSVCEWFSDFSPAITQSHARSWAHLAYHYIGLKFKMLYKSVTGKKLFICKTKARDRSSINEAFGYLIEVIRWEEETQNMYRTYDDIDSFHQSEIIFSPPF